MAVKWDGFSEEDLSKMKSRSDKCNAVLQQVQDSDKHHNGMRIDSESKRKTKMVINSLSEKNGDVGDDPVSFPSAALLPAKVIAQSDDTNQSSKQAIPERPECPQDKVDQQTPLSGSSYHTNKDCLSFSDSKGNRNQSLTSKLVIPSLSQPPPSSINLSEFSTKHKLMEEQNRVRKVFLAKALEDRKKQTNAEQRRLTMIQEELLKLDQRLSCDVSILRNQIEAASVEFMEAQKRYDRAEKEFLDAKLHLYTKLERKELLTHHLCTIIEQNEMRKAKKLSELMEKLQMPETDASQTEEEVAIKQDEPANAEPKRKVSSEIILMPPSNPH